MELPEASQLRQRRTPSRLAVGLMAGTSLDGVDAALVEISGAPERPKVRALAFITTAYPGDLRNRLFQAASGGPLTASELGALHYQVGEAFAQAAIKVCKRGKIDARDLTVIASHGQTIFHQGRGGGQTRACTLQIGEAALIAEFTGAPVVADFRAADVAAGGEGAPLVPMVDYLLLRDRRQGTVALNIGGIANVTIIPAGAPPEQVFGFDTGPGNMVLDGLVRHFTRGKDQYDAEGRFAAKGRLLDSVLHGALSDPFFARRPPKSAGREQFGDHFLTDHFLGRPRDCLEDLVRTATELTARSIATALDRFVFGSLAPGSKLHRLVISGGGTHNKALMERIGALIPSLSLHRSDDFGLPADAKEAIAFAVLGERTLRGLPGNLPGVTGATRPVVLGKLLRP
jgi:anhydro-N-acetylmuramic acid kinase